LEVYVERGYRGTSMQAVADAAGVTKPVVYECYPNKDELLLALLDREERSLMDAISESLPSNLVSDNVEAVLAAGFTAFLSGVGQAPNSWRVVFDSGCGSPPPSREVRSRLRLQPRWTKPSSPVSLWRGAPARLRLWWR